MGQQHLGVDLVTDVDESVIRAAKGGLKSLTGEDFGPTTGATDEQKAKALEQWLIWYATTGKGR